MWILVNQVEHSSNIRLIMMRGQTDYPTLTHAYIGSFNRDARNLLDHNSHVVKVTSVKFVVNCLVVYGKSPWKVIVLSNVQIIKFYYQNQCSVRETFRALRDFYPSHNRPAKSTIRRLVAKFESTGSINNQLTPVRRWNARSAENIAVRMYGKTRGGQFLVVHNNLAFLRLQLGEFCVGTWVCKVPYKIQLIQELKVNIDNRVFADWILEQLEINPNKSSLAMRPIFGWMDMWISKIVEFGTIPIHARYTSSKCIPRMSLFGADFGGVHTSSKTKQALP